MSLWDLTPIMTLITSLMSGVKIFRILSGIVLTDVFNFAILLNERSINSIY